VTQDPWIRRYHEAPDSEVRLVCFPHVGGSASFYFPLSAKLSPAVEVVAIQYPGRLDRLAEANIDNLPELADAIFPILHPMADRPLALFGHSMGAALAYEVALRLEGHSSPPVRLFVSGRRAPSRYRDEMVHQRDDQGIVAELRRLSGTDLSLLDDPATLKMILPSIRSDYKATETYRHTPGRSVTCPIVVLVGDGDSKVTMDEAKAWAEHGTGPFDLRTFPGGHFYLVDQNEALARMLTDDLTTLRPR
jgi:pyochelin biosynthesis protein PchC